MVNEISCQDLAKVYDNGKEALSAVSFTIPTTGIFALIGRNGAGKTTLTRILSTLLEPSTGRATIDGLDVMDDAAELRNRMAVVPQEGRTIPWMSPVQMITSYLLWRGMGYREAKSKAREAVALVGIQEHADRLNRMLSGGMKRKTLVAMVIASGADLIFLDEPSTGLDPISRKELWDLLMEISKDRFLFMTTHYLEEAEAIAGRIGILDSGRLLALGTMDELRTGIGHQYVLRFPTGIELPPFEGRVMVGRDGFSQVMTTEEGSHTLSKALISRGVRFSLNPVSLEDIFYQAVGRKLDGENGEGGE
ncbi:MAG: ABC transporter ATP-binding protein [Methanomassiliicoccus sp.]|nr:ABC transporter ATP-binding protein [Methanomassiliicoccus sp.]